MSWQTEKIAELVPKGYKEIYRRKMLEGLEQMAEAIDESIGVNPNDEIERKRENLAIAIEASYIALDASVEAASNYLYRSKLSSKVSSVTPKLD